MSLSETMSLNNKEIASILGRYGTLLMLAMMILIFSSDTSSFPNNVKHN